MNTFFFMLICCSLCSDASEAGHNGSSVQEQSDQVKYPDNLNLKGKLAS